MFEVCPNCKLKWVEKSNRAVNSIRVFRDFSCMGCKLLFTIEEKNGAYDESYCVLQTNQYIIWFLDDGHSRISMLKNHKYIKLKYHLPYDIDEETLEKLLVLL